MLCSSLLILCKYIDNSKVSAGMAIDWFSASAELSGFAKDTEETTWKEEEIRSTTITV